MQDDQTTPQGQPSQPLPQPGQPSQPFSQSEQPSQPYFPPDPPSQPLPPPGYPSQPFPPQPGYPTQPYPQQPYPSQPFPQQQWSGPMPPPQMLPQPPQKQSNLWFVWVGVAVVFLLVFIFGAVIIAAGNNPNTASSGIPASAPTATQVLGTPTPTDTPQPTATPTTPPTWTTVQSFQGNGNKKTGTFSVPADWRIVWTCDPSSSFGGSYNVIVSVYNADGSPLDLAAINTICHSGNTGDNTEEHQGGSIYLDIESEGAWTVQVQVFK